MRHQIVTRDPPPTHPLMAKAFAKNLINNPERDSHRIEVDQSDTLPWFQPKTIPISNSSAFFLKTVTGGNPLKNQSRRVRGKVCLQSWHFKRKEFKQNKAAPGLEPAAQFYPLNVWIRVWHYLISLHVKYWIVIQIVSTMVEFFLSALKLKKKKNWRN